MFKIGEATIVFLLFFVLIFKRLYYKHTQRTVSYTHLDVYKRQGMFLTLAQEKGYAVHPNVLNKWKRFQRCLLYTSL